MDRGEIAIRPIVAADASTVADLHATSWRDAYRGMLRDEYLDADVAGDRRRVWTSRLGDRVHSEFGFIAEAAGDAVGFVFLCGRADALKEEAKQYHHFRRDIESVGTRKKPCYAQTPG